jgi:fructoselysine-6-P-deglycase FrlB-like protein
VEEMSVPATEMSQVEKALRSQREVWPAVVQEVIKNGYPQMLPPLSPKRILFFGVGSSYIAAKLTSLSLIREAGKKRNSIAAPVFACSSTQIDMEMTPERGDWVFAFSHRGKTPATLKAAEICARVGAFVVWVSAQEVDLPVSGRFLLPTSSLEQCEPHTVGLTSAVCAVTTLLAGAAMAENWKTLSSMPNPSFSALRERAAQGPKVVLGEWEGEWIAREARLKLIEMSGLFPQAFGSEEFFHGPEAVLRKQSGTKSVKVSGTGAVVGTETETEKAPGEVPTPLPGIWYFSHPSDPRKKDIQASYQVNLASSHSVSWVSALVEAQWLCLAVALNLGVNPDGV